MAEAEAANDKTAGASKAPSCDVTTIAFVSFLRSEAEAAESRAKQLRAQADKLIHDHGLEQHFQNTPKNLGGKKTKRKRSNDPEQRNRRKQLTGYTLFMKETNPTIREEGPSLSNQDVVQRVAQLWSEKSDEQKQEWKSKAEKHNIEAAKTDEGVDKAKAKANNLERNVDNEGNEAEANKKNETSDIV